MFTVPRKRFGKGVRNAYGGNVRLRDGSTLWRRQADKSKSQTKISTNSFELRRAPKRPATCHHFLP